MNLNTAVNRQTDPNLEAINIVTKLSSLIPIPGIQKVIKPLNVIVKMFTPSPADQIKEELNEINQKLDNIYGLVQEALTEDDIKVLMRSNVSLFVQIQDVALNLDPPHWHDALSMYASMVENYTTAAQHANDFLKHYENVNLHADGYLIQYIGGFANTICQFYSMYALLQHTTNILIEKNVVNTEEVKEQSTELLMNEQRVIINCVTNFINRALGKESTNMFDFEYPSWCKNVFMQGTVMIASLDGRRMKYSSNSKSEFICLSESYVEGTVCEEFKISFVDIENPQGLWELMLQPNKYAGMESYTQPYEPGIYTPTTNDYLVINKKSSFIIKYNGTNIIICIENNNIASSVHLGAEPHHARRVLANKSSYKWNIISINSSVGS